MLNLGHLPNLPQSEFLKELLPRIWADEAVIALWLGGSLANDGGDAYSDIDLRLAVAADALDVWRNINLEDLFGQPVLAQFLNTYGDEVFLHHLILGSGEIYDLYVQTPTHPLSKEKRLVFASRDPNLLAKLQVEEQELGMKYPLADPAQVKEMLDLYWTVVHKGQKVSYRGLVMLNWEGINLMRSILLRLYYIQATDNDCGDLRRMTIHAWTPVTQVIQESYGDRVLNLIGSPTISKADVVEVIALLNQETALVGRALAQQLGFAYPEALETMVRQSWAAFVDREMG